MGRIAWALTIALLVLGGCGGGEERTAAPAKSVTPLDRTTVGTISGTARFEGTPPPMQPLPVDRWPGCSQPGQGPVLSGDALVHDGAVENVFVYIKSGLGDRTFAAPTTAVVIDQRGCTYHPRVAGAQVGQPIEFLNSDALLHNVHSDQWNFSMAVKGAERTVRLDKPEVMMSVRCDLHPWMQMYLGVLEHPYFAVTGADARFSLRDVPPGDYVVGAWHERFGTREARVTLAPKGSQDVTFTFTGQ